MALKDWKKAVNDTAWYRIDDKYTYVQVWKIGLPSYERKSRGIGQYAVSGRIGRDGENWKRYFKRKSSAMLYAKNYMRKN